VITSMALIPAPAFAQSSASPAAGNASQVDVEKRAVAHPPIDAASGTRTATSLPILAPPLSDTAENGHPSQPSTPDAPLPKPY
jgi:hypothetical protein